MQDIRKVFESRDTDNSGRIDMSEMSAAMKDLKVDLSEDEVKTLFKVPQSTNHGRTQIYLPLAWKLDELASVHTHHAASVYLYIGYLIPTCNAKKMDEEKR